MNGFAASLTWFSCMRGPQQWFSKRRGLAVGITMSASGIGGLCFSNILQAAIESVGHAWALRILGFMQLVLVGIAAAACLRLCPPQKNVPLVDYQDLKNKPFLLLLFIHFIGNFAFYVRFLFSKRKKKRLEADFPLQLVNNRYHLALYLVSPVSLFIYAAQTS